MNKLVKTADLYECNVPYLKELFDACEYPWEMLGQIKGLCKKLIEEGMESFTEIEPGILVGRDVTIAKTATIIAPAIIGHGTEIRPGAYLRGNVITGENCVLGNSSEFKNCILLDKVQAPHYNYVGDSVLGNKAHMGAGSICSNLKSDGKAVVVHGETNIETGIRKIGGILADGADIGCGCVINPGTVIGKKTSVYPLTALRGVIPANCIVKALDNIVERKD
ncbi:MAG: UDP-N-acetylglucosamine pyrophosphorylase [Oscillospiraceae bacterium]|nr:UDP-N-acetylglucosamine pyrophosphorylase [Oscillospiraceae bacterium]